MGGPVALGWLFVAVFLTIGAYCLTRVVAATGPWVCHDDVGHGLGRDVDLAHVVMGVGMAAMLSPAGDPVPRLVWTILFGATAVWFMARMVREWPRLREARPSGRAWYWHHIVEPLAMLYMVWAMSMPVRGPMPSVMSGMAMTGTPGGGALTATVTTALLGYFGWFMVWSTRQLVRVPARAALASGGSSAVGVLLSPRLAVSCHTLICVGMAYGLVLMLQAA